MTLMNALKWSTEQLKRSDIDSAPLDAEILLSSVLNKSREYILTYKNNNLTMKQWNNFRRLIKRQKNNEPIAYIIGEKEFYGLKFKVNKNVLIPRPETELLVESAMKQWGNGTMKNKILIDIGTGSGCIPISITKNLKNQIKIYAADISRNALKIAKQNAKLNGVSQKITFLHGDLLKPFEKHSRNIRDKIREVIITANLPYIPTSEWQKLPPNIKNHEPRTALDGGKDGLKYYRCLLKQIKSAKSAGLCPSVLSMFLEIAPNQKNKLKKLILKHFPKAQITFHKDLAGKWRVAEIKL
jgi:release factor glutamine methyltransferase